MALRDGTTESMHEVVTGLLKRMHWMPLKEVALATDGISSMTGHRTGLAARMRVEVPTLINVHCIAHREALVAGDAARSFPDFQMLDRFANKTYEWVDCSINQRNELKRLLKGVFEEYYVVILQIHTVRWFSRSNVMTHLLQCMPALLKLFKDEESHWYDNMYSFKFHFYLNLLVDVLQELNKLNIKFQYDMVDITTISATIDITISSLSRHFLSGNRLMFGRTSKNLENFLRKSTENLQLTYENNIEDRIIHALSTDGPNELQQYVLLGASYVQRIVHALNDRFPDLPIFNAAKFFSPRNYPNDDSDQITNTELWLESILLKFQYTEEENDMCKGELLEFTETLRHECENKTIFEA